MIATLLVVMVWEMIWPRREVMPGQLYRWSNNLGLTFISQGLMYYADSLLLVLTAWFVQRAGIGILPTLDLPWLLVFIVTLLTLDLTGYLVHVMFHKVEILWRFHAIHHSDTGLDFSSTYRHHPVEMLVNSFFGITVLAFLGAPLSAVFAAEVVRGIMIFTGHANIYLPEKVDRVLRLFLVTPDFHRLHHCSERQHTDSNYGAIVPWFDYLFGTASNRSFNEQRTMQLGLEYYRDRKSSRLDQMLLLPFLRFKVSEGNSPKARL